MCLICMKYRIIILITIIISLGQILLSYENTSRTHAFMHAHTHIHTHRRAFQVSDGSVAPNRDGPLRWRQWASLFHSNKHARAIRFPEGLCFSRIKKCLGRTCDRMCFQAIRTVDSPSIDTFRARITKH